jgi:hypothetical protein
MTPINFVPVRTEFSFVFRSTFARLLPSSGVLPPVLGSVNMASISSGFESDSDSEARVYDIPDQNASPGTLRKASFLSR